MTKDQSQRQSRNSRYNDIDIFDLIESIWKEKILIIVITALVTSLALAYAFTAKPTYEASTTFYQPSVSAIQSYNLGRREAELPEYTISAIYDIFLTNLNSSQLRDNFFDEIYLPSLDEAKQASARSKLIAALDKILTVKQLNTKENKYLYQISVELEDADKTAEWANLYLQKAITQTKAELKDDINSEMRTYKESIKLQIDNLLIRARAERQDEITRLKEALSIAKAIGLENPALPTGKATEEGANYVDRNLTYMRGSKALESQIQAFEARKDDQAFIPTLRELTAKLNFLDSIYLNDENTEVVKIDQIALTPDSPIKPKKLLIIVMSVLLGGMLGVLTALIRTAVRQREKHPI